MSSRALRKAQKEREKQDVDARQMTSDDEESDEEHAFAAAPSKPSAFQMLSQMQENDSDEEEGQEREEIQDTEGEDDINAPAEISATKPQASNQKKKKKKKRKSSKAQPAAPQSQVDPGGVDDIDAAIRAATLEDDAKGLQSKEAGSDVIGNPGDEELEICPHLSIDVHHLQVSNEMRRLFGRAAFDAELEERAQNQTNRGPPSQSETVPLKEAVSGRLSTGGPGLPAVLRRRNIFAQGKEEWPRQTGNGLSMEIEARNANGITVYRFVHTTPYKTVQSIFAQFVAIMDPTNLVNLLRFNPYHIATLLQVSEIAKHERDHTTSGELLERALFAFGKALHPSFAANVAKGKARLNFRRPENREFFLAAWKYVENIGMRATWRTAYEWTRLLLSLDPSGDHYCVRLVIDKLALRAKQAKSFLDLACTKFFAERWSSLANIRYSLSLAQRTVDGDTPESEQLLRQAVQAYPWVGARLFQELNIDKIPPSVWGSTPPTSKEKLHSEIYVTLGIDIWKPADATKFLTQTVTDTPKDSKPPLTEVTTTTATEPDIIPDEARFIFLADKPALMGLIPPAVIGGVESMADPLPPDDSINSYEVHRPSRLTHENVTQQVQQDSNVQARIVDGTQTLWTSPRRFIDRLTALQGYLVRLLRNVPRVSEGSAEPTFEALVEHALARSDVGLPIIRGRLEALTAYREVLTRQPGQRVVSEDGAEVLIEDGRIVTVLPEGDDVLEVEQLELGEEGWS